MEELRSYILSVTAAAILCALLATLAGKSGAISSLMKLMSGVVMAAVIIRPMADLSVINLHRYLDDLNMDAAAAVAYGTDISNAEVRQRIIEASEAYILDKAALYSLEIEVSVALDEASMAPCSVEIHGTASPSARREIETIIQEELGIPLEAQTWK